MVRVNSPGVCSAIKSRPCRIQRSLSRTSLDVRGSVVMEKVWMFEGMTEGISTEQLSEEDTQKDPWCPKHSWFLFTNLLTAQQCSKCSRRILPKRTAYKCTACKRLCHLKCAADNSNNNTRESRLRPRKGKSTMDFQDFVPKQDAYTCRFAKKTSSRRRPYRETYDREEIEEVQQPRGENWPIDQIDNVDTEQQMADLPSYSDVMNASRQSQAKQKISSMKHGFVKKCRSFKKKVKTLKNKVQHTEESKLSDDQVRQDSTTTTSSTQEEQVAQQREAWVRSPIRTRLRERQLQMRRDSFKTRSAARRSNLCDETSMQKVTRGSQMSQRNSKRQRFQIYDLDLVSLRDRVFEVEKRVNELETAIPQEIAEWHKLKKKFNRQGYGNAYSKRNREGDIEEQIIHETHPKHLEAMGMMPSVSSGTTSDEVYIVPDHQHGSSSLDEPDHMTPGVGHMAYGKEHVMHSPYNSLHEDSLPSGIPGKLRFNLGHDTSEKNQTSTPVTERELSFLSASRAYKNTHQIQHTNVTQISVEHSYNDPNLTRKEEIKLERSVSFEKSAERILSPEQLAVENFLQKRRKSSPRQSSGRKIYTRPTRRKSRSPERNVRYHSSPLYRTNSRSRSNSPVRRGNPSTLYSSPPIASSTFREEDFGSKLKRSEISPLPYTLENSRFENGHHSFGGEHFRLETDQNGQDRNTSSASNLSYTFRNDSQMVQTNAEEDLPGYTRNYNMYQQNPDSETVDTSSDNDQAHGIRVTFQADVEKRSPTSRAQHVKRDSISTQITTTTDDGMSLTNVTAVTGDFANSFTETVNNSSRSRWVNKDVYMFEKERGEYQNRSRYAQSYEKVDATGDWRKPPIPSKRCSSASEIDFLKEAEKRLEDYKIRRSGDNLSAGVYLEKLPRSSMMDDFQTDSVEVNEHIVRDFANEESAWKLHAEQSYLSSKQKRSDRQGSPKRRSSSPSRSSSPRSKNVSPRASPHFRRRDTTQKRYSSPLKSSPSRRNTDMHNSPSPQKKHHDRSPLSQRNSGVRTHYNPAHSNPVNVDSTSEFEDFERQLQEESLRNHRRSFSLTNLKKYQLLPSNGYTLRENSTSCTNSIDGETRSLINESARYHFLHDKGMIKISSPSLKILNGSPATRRKFEPEYNHIDEESSDMVQSGSESGMSGVYVDNKFHIQGKTSSEIDSKQTESEVTGSLSTSTCTTQSMRQQHEQERELFEQCLKTADENQEDWDHVLDWMNKEYNEDDDAELEYELNTLMQQEDYETEQRQHHSGSPNDNSVYYSFAGQSEDLESILSPLQKKSDQRRHLKGKYHDAVPSLMQIICNGTVQDVGHFLNSDLTISEEEIKEALLWAINVQNYDITLLLLEDICKLIQAAEGDACIDVFPAYQERDRWQPIFVVLTKLNIQGEWDSFMEFPVFRRRHDLVSSESTAVINSNYVRSHPLSFDEQRTVKRAVSSVNLQKSHSKITLINACSCRSRKGGKILEEGLCIVIHCLIKGFIPFNEEPFPRKINGIPVDVREGYFRHGVAIPNLSDQMDIGRYSGDESASTASIGSRGSACISGSSSQSVNNKRSLRKNKKSAKHRDRSPRAAVETIASLDLKKKRETESCQEATSKMSDEVINKKQSSQNVEMNKETVIERHLLMGTKVEDDSKTGGGSLGGFVSLPGGNVGFLTCARIFKEIASADGLETQMVYTRYNSDSTDRYTCGEVLKSACNPGSCDNPGVDAAVVKITSNDAYDGNFIAMKREQFETLDSAPNFAKGRVQKFSDLSADQLQSMVIKVGATTGLNKGQIYSGAVYVKDVQHLNEKEVELYNQFEVVPKPETKARLFDVGDSGTLVFVASSTSDLSCVGLAVGFTNYGSCIVTPIKAIFDALDLPHQFIDFTNC